MNITWFYVTFIYCAYDAVAASCEMCVILEMMMHRSHKLHLRLDLHVCQGFVLTHIPVKK
jgi:hypothetical protein